MAAVNFYELKLSPGFVLRSERSLDKLVKWIGRHQTYLNTGCYEIVYAGMKIVTVFKDANGSIHFDTFFDAS